MTQFIKLATTIQHVGNFGAIASSNKLSFIDGGGAIAFVCDRARPP
ncbi:MAG: hypothetical protein AB4042_01095 [Leptolyngbyaceae cyanobacterium]